MPIRIPLEALHSQLWKVQYRALKATTRKYVVVYIFDIDNCRLNHTTRSDRSKAKATFLPMLAVIKMAIVVLSEELLGEVSIMLSDCLVSALFTFPIGKVLSRGKKSISRF